MWEQNDTAFLWIEFQYYMILPMFIQTIYGFHIIIMIVKCLEYKKNEQFGKLWTTFHHNVKKYKNQIWTSRGSCLVILKNSHCEFLLKINDTV